MRNPPHPGLSVKHDCIEALGLTVTRAAEILCVTRQTLNELVHRLLPSDPLSFRVFRERARVRGSRKGDL